MKFTPIRRLCCSLFLAGLLLGSYKGRIALWKDSGKEPWKVFPYPVSALPAEEQAALKKGIHVDTMEDLNRLLENFLS